METEIIEVLKYWKTLDAGFDGSWLGYSRLLDEINERLTEKTTLKNLKIEMKRLRENNIVDYLPCYDDEGKLFGKGYFLND